MFTFTAQTWNMDELNNKLSAGNPVVISQVFSKLVENLKNRQESDKLESLELKFLKEKCFSPKNTVSIVASEAILQFIRTEDPSVAKDIIADLIAVITTSKNPYSNVTYLINNLLLVDVENELSKNTQYKCYYNLRLPQHPLIVILSEDPNSWSSVFKEISYSYSKKNIDVSYWNELYKPVFLYILCNPHESSNLSILKQKLWTFIIHQTSSNSDHHFLYNLLSWMQFERRATVHKQPDCLNTILVNADLLIELADLNILDPNILLLWETAALHQLVLNNFDPRAMIWSLQNILTHHSDTTILNPVVLILAKTIPLCSSANLLQLMKLCQLVIHKAKCDVITVQIISASLLQWIANPSSLTSAAVTVANQILLFLKNNSHSKLSSSSREYLKFSTEFEKLINTNSDVYITLQLYVLLEKWKSNHDIRNWLVELEKAPIFFVNKIVDFLFGLFLTDFNDCEINTKAFELILKCVDCNKTLASNVLIIILYKLTSTVDSNLHYQLLKSVPKMAVLKDNVQKIVGTIQALNKGKNALSTFSTTLMLDVWKIDNKCYPYLEKFLIVPYNSQCDKFEFYVTRANVLKELCALRPELYGKEMVAHLSKILNECNNADGALACALAIEGITLLCKFEVIDAVTTWATLAPIFKSENRIQVPAHIKIFLSSISSVCKLPMASILFLLVLTSTVILANEVHEFISANNWFAASISKEILKNESENFLISPFSTEAILALTESRAQGETAQELRTSLHLPHNRDAIRKAFKMLLPSLKTTQNYSFHIANKIYVKKNYRIKEELRKVSKDVFFADFENIDFSRNLDAAHKMNKWVEENTNHKIRNLIDPNSIDGDTRAVLINAVYFQANWTALSKIPFTYKDDFYRNGKTVIQVETMHDSNYYNYFENPKLDAKFLELPFTGDNISMIFVLPRDREGLRFLKNQLEEVFLSPKYSKEVVNVWLPKFKIESTMDVTDMLKNLGVVKAFTYGVADFGGISNDKLVINNVMQKTFIDVDERGVEATTATYVDVSKRIMDGATPEIIKQFKADHPFLFYIKIRDVVVFVGRVSHPIAHITRPVFSIP